VILSVKHYIIPIFIPHYGCSHQCVFCNQRRITGQATPVTADEVATIIDWHLTRLNQPRQVEVAFYGGSFTALPKEVQQALLRPAYNVLKQGKIHKIRLSTRPDCIDETTLALLKDHKVTTIELGAQSLDDNVLAAAARGHSSQAVAQAARLIKAAGFSLGLQLMLGLPAEDWVSSIKSAYKVLDIGPDFVRIYPTLVIENTPLAVLYRQGKYAPLTLSQAVSRAAGLKLLFERHSIKVIRTGLQASPDLADPSVVLAGPYHPSFGELVESHIYYLMVASVLQQAARQNGDLVIRCHCKDESKLRGNRNHNLLTWRKEFAILTVEIIPGLPHRDQLVISYRGLDYIVNRDMLIHI